MSGNIFVDYTVEVPSLPNEPTVAATVNGAIVVLAPKAELRYVFALIFAYCQYLNLKLVDANIRFFKADENPSQAASLDEASVMWRECPELLNLFNVSYIAEIRNVNDIFKKMEEFAEVLKGHSLQELFPHGRFPTEDKEDSLQMRAS